MYQFKRSVSFGKLEGGSASGWKRELLYQLSYGGGKSVCLKNTLIIYNKKNKKSICRGCEEWIPASAGMTKKEGMTTKD